MSLTTGIVFLTLFVGIFLLLLFGSERKKEKFVLSDSYRQLLQQHVHFYNHLYNDDKRAFEKRMEAFLSAVRITGVKTVVEDLDRVLIAASAIIPIFRFKNWWYTNLHEVLLYPGAFGENFSMEQSEEMYGGMVGWGALQNSVVLSQTALRAGFLTPNDTRNTGIHEFVHLIDKTDGATDGVPENIMEQQYILPWLQLIQKEMKKIAEGASTIDVYGATNQSEFFAVVSEYFFEKPDQLQAHHPELFALLEKIFQQQPLPKGGA